MRGLIGNTQQDAKFVVSGSTFTGLLTGVYLNPGNDATVTNSTFTNNTAGVGGVGTGTLLSVSGSRFAGNAEDIGVEGNQKIGSFALTGNTDLNIINVYSSGVGRDFNVGNVNAQNVVLVAAGGSVNDAIAPAAGGKILLGAGTHLQTV
jgi:hypothetical protein